MDALSLDIRALKKSCIHIAQPDGRLIPFESLNLFYRDEKARKLQELRQEVAASTERRLGRSVSTLSVGSLSGRQPPSARLRGSPAGHPRAAARVFAHYGYDEGTTNRIAAAARSVDRLAVPVLPEQGRDPVRTHRRPCDAGGAATMSTHCRRAT